MAPRASRLVERTVPPRYERARLGGVSLPKLALVGSFKWPEGDGYPIV
jgi:hypothetical protein